MSRTRRYDRIEPYRPPAAAAADQAPGTDPRAASHARTRAHQPQPGPSRPAPVKPRSHAKPDAERMGGLQELEAVDVDGVAATTIGTILWAVAFLILLPFRDNLEANGHGNWLWTCLAGFGLGLWGIAYCRYRRASIARARRTHRRSADR